MRYLRAGICLIVAAAAAYGQNGAGKATAPSDAPDAPADTDEAAALVDITLQTSRPELSVSTHETVFASIHNISHKTLLFRESQTVFVLSAETRPGEHSRRGCAVFPAMGNSVEAKDYRPNQELDLLPGETTTVFWDLETNGCKGFDYDLGRSWWGDQMAWFRNFSDRSTFQSGNYKIVFDATFSVMGETIQHNVTKVMEAKFVASQSIILFGAMMGGFVAFVVKRMMGSGGDAPAGDVKPLSLPRLKPILLPFLASGLLSVTLVILGTQIADTGFPVKVDASNFVGAFTAGFLLNFAGLKLIQQLTLSAGGGAGKDDQAGKDKVN